MGVLVWWRVGEGGGECVSLVESGGLWLAV